ncbi:MAG TPA: DUF3147 family protein [Bryobacteraceae bacterium]|nr:DUF3147 family protein [Bryobacteraceae bacterium]
MGETIMRFLVGGMLVSVFAILGDMIKPKRLAGIFGAAPSVALATLGLTIAKDGPHMACTEGRSMLVGATALCVYSLTVVLLLMRWRLRAVRSALVSLVIWFAAAFGLWSAFLQ